tara:strand:+ start:6493 stop:7173 length:681 start_codon:yes stop_codon:yes gene_type:complete
MRILKYFDIKIEEKKEEKGVEKLIENVRNIDISIPCHFNIYFTEEEPRISFNINKRSINYCLKDGFIKINKRSDYTQGFNSNESIDLYLSKPLSKITLRGDTIFEDFDFGLFDNLEMFNNAEAKIHNFKKNEININAINNTIVEINSEKPFIEYLEISASSNSKIYAKKLNALKVHSVSASYAQIEAHAIEELNAEVKGTSLQKIYGNPPAIDKKIESIGSLKIVD